MWRLIIYIIIALFAAAGLVWWIDNPGNVTINWFSWQIDTSFAALVFILVVILVFALFVQAAFVWVKREFPILGENRHLDRQKRGLKALNKAIVALAVGNGKEARRLVIKAQKLLPPQPMMQVVSAQAAKLEGDNAAAQKEFKTLMKSPEAAFLGVRGLLTNAIAEGKSREARRLAEKAFELNPRSAWATKTLFDMQVKATDWAEARLTLESGKRAKVFTKLEAKKLLATLYYCQAKEAELMNDKTEARRLLGLGFRSYKYLLPAVLMASRFERDNGNIKKAENILIKAWSITPHPDIAEAYGLIDPMETPTSSYKRFKKLCHNNPNAVDSLLLLAEKAMDSNNLKEADLYLRDVFNLTDRAKAYLLRARLEEEKGSSKNIVQKWLVKAEKGSPEPLWVCRHCEAKTKNRSLVCNNCQMFNTLEWESDSDNQVKDGFGREKNFLGLSSYS